MTTMASSRRHFNVAEAKARLSQLVKKALEGEDVVIARDNKPLVRLVPVLPVGRHRRPGTAEGHVKMAKDFGAPLEDMKEYT
jgi:prevent-host-death family protein